MPKQMRDLTRIEMDDMPEPAPRRAAPVAPPAKRPMAPPMAGKRPMANPADANIFTADKGIQPPSPDEGPTLDRGMRGMPRRPGMKKGGCVKKAAGGKVGSASKRADGCAIKGKTKGKMI